MKLLKNNKDLIEIAEKFGYKQDGYEFWKTTSNPNNKNKVVHHYICFEGKYLSFGCKNLDYPYNFGRNIKNITIAEVETLLTIIQNNFS